jgi:HK97 family phage prohead protease
MTSKYEIKNTTFELKEISDEGVISGYGSVFGVTDLGNDIVMKGAFNRTLNTGKTVKMLWQHNREEPIGVWTDIKTDDHGLVLTGQLALNTQKGRETHELLKLGALDGLSIGFIAVDTEFNSKGEREIKEVNLKEVSVVTFPMNEDATVMAVKSEHPDLTVEQIKEVSEFIRTLVEPEEEIDQKDEIDTIAEDLADILSENKDAQLSNDINTLIKK